MKNKPTEVLMDCDDLVWIDRILNHSYKEEYDDFTESHENDANHIFHDYDKLYYLRMKIETQLKSGKTTHRFYDVSGMEYGKGKSNEKEI